MKTSMALYFIVMHTILHKYKIFYTHRDIFFPGID